MKILRIILMILLLVVVVVVVGGFLIYNDTMRGPLPQTSGSLSVVGLNAQVEVLRDEWGVPHIYASDQHDLFFAQGFVQAQDRWWQMEFFRHTGSGSIEELTGKTDSLIGTDVFIRTAGWRRTAETEVAQMGEAERAMLQAFADGVNAYITSRPPDDLAMQYRLLGVTGVKINIEPWTPVDTVVWGKVMAWNLTDTTGNEYTRQALYETIGAAMAQDFYTPPYPYESASPADRPTILYPDDLPITDASGSPSSGADTAGKISSSAGDRQLIESETPVNPLMAGSTRPGEFAFSGSDPGIGSNNWVATGSMTANGTPLLANDPHLGIQMPSIWYEVGLHCLPVTEQCPQNVVGFALSPAPGVIIGHNDHIAWGVTNVGADVQDLYQITVNPENPLQYQWNGEWRDMTVHDETINFGDGEAAVTIQVRETHLGPIINDNQINDETGEIEGFNNADPLVMRWTGSDVGTLFNAVLNLNIAANWEQFRNALRDWNVPSQNFVYADVQGNIGYQTPGSMPIRPAGIDGLTPSPASSDTDVWQGYIPFDDLPRIYNPARDYIVTANQAVVPPEYYDQLAEKTGEDANYSLGYDWAYGQRAQRITELLQQFAPNTVETYQQIQGDNKNVDAPQIVPYLANLTITDGAVDAARTLLLGWDYQMQMSSAPAALFAEFDKHLLHNLYDDQLPDDDPSSNHQLYPTTQLLNQPDNVWWDDASTSDVVEQRDDILLRSFSEAVQAATTAMGSDMTKWEWGKLHGATFVSNPLGASGIDLIEQLVNRGPFAVSGGSDSVNATGWNPADADFAVSGLPSMRMIVDVANFDNSLTMHTTGQSGHPASPHYA
ncbi:MAG: penicillin acylase family protein, partial [Chloroflexota bacterium]